MIVNVFDERAPGKHGVAPLEKGKNVIVVHITRNMTMEHVVSEIKKKVEAAGGGPESITLMRFFGHGNAGTMDFGKEFRYWTVKSFKDLASYIDPNGKGLELHGCYTGSAVHVPGQDCLKPGRFYPREQRPGVVGLGFELLLALSEVLKTSVTGGINCQYGDPAHKLEGPTITVSPDGITMRNVPIDKYDDRGQPSKDSPPVQPESQVDLRPDLTERIRILEDADEEPGFDWQPQQASTLPDLTERIRILEDADEEPGFDWQPQQASTLPDLTERIRILEDADEEPGFDWQPQSDPLDNAFDFDRPNRFSLQPQSDPLDNAFDFDRPNRFSLQPQSDPLDNAFDFDRPNRFSLQSQQPFTNQSPSERFGADRLTDFPGQKPFQSFEGPPQWMNQQFSEPPQGSQVNLRPQPFTDKPMWKK